MNFNTCPPCATCTLRPGVPYVCCAKTAGYVGIVQSVILLIIAIVALEFISREYEEKYGQWIVLYPTNFTDINWGIFYVDYLVDGYGRSTVLFYIMALYLPISLLWLGASVLILCRIRYNYMPRPKRRCTLFAFVLWSVITFIICLVDLVATIILIASELSYLSNPIELPVSPTAESTTETVETTQTTKKGWIFGYRQRDGKTTSTTEPEPATEETTTDTTTIKPSPTYMWWDNTTLIDHDNTYDEVRIHILYGVLLFLMRFLFLWLLNFALSTFLIAAPFAWRDEYHCTSDCKLAIRRGMYNCPAQRNICPAIDPCLQEPYSLEYNSPEPCLEVVPPNYCYQTKNEVKFLEDGPQYCNQSEGDGLKPISDTDQCHINDIIECKSERVIACATQTSHPDRSSGDVCKEPTVLKYSCDDSNNIKTCLRKPKECFHTQDRHDSDELSCRKRCLDKRPTKVSFNTSKNERCTYYVPNSDSLSSKSGLWASQSNPCLQQSQICKASPSCCSCHKGAPSIRNKTTKNSASTKNYICPKNTCECKTRNKHICNYISSSEYPKSSSSCSDQQEQIPVYYCSRSAAQHDNSCKKRNSKMLTYDIDTNYPQRPFLHNHLHKSCLGCEILSLNCIHPHQSCKGCKMNMIVSNHTHVPCDKCYSTNSKCYHMHELCPGCLNFAIITNHEHISCEDCIQKNLLCCHIHRNCIGCRNCLMVLNHDHISCDDCINEHLTCVHVHGDCPGCSCETNSINHPHLPCVDCTDSNLVCVHKHSTCSGCQRIANKRDFDSRLNFETNTCDDEEDETSSSNEEERREKEIKEEEKFNREYLVRHLFFSRVGNKSLHALKDIIDKSKT